MSNAAQQNASSASKIQALRMLLIRRRPVRKDSRIRNSQFIWMLCPFPFRTPAASYASAKQIWSRTQGRYTMLEYLAKDAAEEDSL